ncbi:MAG: biopolymer transporter ExbD [Prevotella pectinovora]|jgi:biopolymer transport protein ExbD|uniref:Biopolymer transporter ExbD n=1 Tax=Prevotella pectinovora TaxID=1602169 RepID=A0A0D0IT14_9BACT|nr:MULTISPECIES: biopolymer transporter ExbD [Prevotella]KIP60069.1 biopolymer transporter ExbD [Prevotella pectinovora]KIP61155.1 biopolymer transporter ExbD [Prevotella pectinovora]KIP63475.1 biopolymer transporter ExbD [Prevotella pectinovora]MCI6048590.1 biopolymer transporter ExbD [Prevotella pectinovora]MDD7743282.1 biopolymer transporter ExbD [Prevotella pectinovora]
MGKIKIKKADVWIDMTPMSDVMVLLLTFFMLTSTFVKNEAVKVNAPGSVSEIKVPETEVLQIIVDKDGKIFIGLDKPGYMQEMLEGFKSKFSGLSLSAMQEKNFVGLASFGMPMNKMSDVLKHEAGDVNNLQKEMGIPTDSINGGMSEFQCWVDAARNSSFGDKMKVAIKADAATPYKVVKKMMSELQDMSENRYYLITTLKKEEAE